MGIEISRNVHISIHALREEGDGASSTTNSRRRLFLSTPSARRATRTGRSRLRPSSNFYPRPPRGGRRISTLFWSPMQEFLSTPSARRATYRGVPLVAPIIISIHALREEGDILSKTSSDNLRVFLSTPSARRATEEQVRTVLDMPISIHALREEGDVALDVIIVCIVGISIHALREEGDSVSAAHTAAARYFYPRPPRGGRLNSGIFSRTPRIFLSTPSARRATAAAQLQAVSLLNFYPRPPRGGRRQNPICSTPCRLFLSTPSARRATQPPLLESLEFM